MDVALTFTWFANRPNIGLMGVHLMQKALDVSIAHARTRAQFGSPIGRFQLVQEMLAEMSMALDASRLLCYRVLGLLDRGLWCHRESLAAKLFATEAAVRVTNLAIQLHGAYGLTKEAPLERWARDARMLTIPDGTTQNTSSSSAASWWACAPSRSGAPSRSPGAERSTLRSSSDPKTCARLVDIS